MRISPRREILEYLDSIGVNPPVSMSTPNKSDGMPTPSKFAKSARGRGCLLLLLVPPLLAASAALLRLLALLVVIVGFLNESRLLMAQVIAPPPVVSPTTTEAADQGGPTANLDLDVAATKTVQPESSAPQFPADGENICLAGKSSGDIGGIKTTFATEKNNKSSSTTDPKVPRLHAIGESSRWAARPEPTRPTWESRTVTSLLRLELRSLGVVLAIVAFLLLAYYMYSESTAPKSPLRTTSNQLRVNQHGGQRKLPNHRYYRENSNAKASPASTLGIKSISEPSTWRTGGASIPGNVRSENQDGVAVFEFRGFQVLLIADGCGGVPHGAAASRLAIEACAKEILWSLVSESVGMEIVIERGFASASDALRRKGRELGLDTLEAGLRTTLIVAIGTKSEFYWGYIGDGALKVINAASGQKHECMIAHRSDSATTNVLTASLGPTLHGTPQFGRRPRKPGDVLLAGTDGVFDRVDDRFTRDVMRMAIYHHGNLTQAVLASLEQLACVSDSTGAYVCDDNLSLGILADGSRPTFQPEFWNNEVLNT